MMLIVALLPDWQDRAGLLYIGLRTINGVIKEGCMQTPNYIEKLTSETKVSRSCKRYSLSLTRSSIRKAQREVQCRRACIQDHYTILLRWSIYFSLGISSLCLLISV